MRVAAIAAAAATDAAPEPTRDGPRFGAWARARREALGLTLVGLARRLGAAGVPVRPNYLTLVEIGRIERLPEQPLFSLWCRALDADEADALRAAGLLPGAGAAPAGLDALVADLPEAQRATVRRIVRDVVEMAKGDR